MPYPHPPRNDGRVTLQGVDVLSALMPDSAEMLGRHLLLIGRTATCDSAVLLVRGALGIAALYLRQSPRQVAVPLTSPAGLRHATAPSSSSVEHWHSGTVLHTGTVPTPHSRVGLLRGALSESGNKEKYALVNITGRTEEASRPTPHKKMNGLRYIFH